MKELTPELNLDAEVEALVVFISQKWTPIANIKELFTEIRDAAFHSGRAWFDRHRVYEAALKMHDAREELLEAHGMGSDAQYHDAYCTLLSHVSRKVDNASEAALLVDGAWDFERRTKRLATAMCEKYPDLYAARPLGWDALALGYSDFDGQEEYAPRPDRELFQGCKVQGTLSADFPGRVALPYVMYDEKCQNRKAFQSLVGAVFAHFLGVIAFLNTNKLLEDLKAAIPAVDTPEMLFERNVVTSNPVLLFILEDLRPAPTKGEFDEAQVRRTAWDALSEDEKNVLKMVNEKSISDTLNALLAESKASTAMESYEQRQATRMAQAKRLNELFDAPL